MDKQSEIDNWMDCSHMPSSLSKAAKVNKTRSVLQKKFFSSYIIERERGEVGWNKWEGNTACRVRKGVRLGCIWWVWVRRVSSFEELWIGKFVHSKSCDLASWDLTTSHKTFWNSQKNDWLSFAFWTWRQIKKLCTVEGVKWQFLWKTLQNQNLKELEKWKLFHPTVRQHILR